MVSAYPIGKIAVLGIKQIATPFSKVLKTFAQNNSIFKKYICAPAGQIIHWIETRSKMHMLRLPQPKRVPKLSDDMAISMGANLLSEVFTMGLGLLMIYIESSRKAKKDKVKNDLHRENQEKLRIEIETLNNLLDWQKKQIYIILLFLKIHCFYSHFKALSLKIFHVS
ncbi:PREDICTED: putative OPA3-like protein CG43998 [Drosophila arizonae]|uniref:OPA3-like protein CG43998 n=1 Tax=Drosophila arizonae TaxID=7263 RepID=A0ABM1P432_DROAR|nr:PREDICTED: putative OPA3-like protein CG43998 [Drosophila arizonae]